MGLLGEYKLKCSLTGEGYFFEAGTKVIVISHEVNAETNCHVLTCEAVCLVPETLSPVSPSEPDFAVWRHQFRRFFVRMDDEAFGRFLRDYLAHPFDPIRVMGLCNRTKNEVRHDHEVVAMTRCLRRSPRDIVAMHALADRLEDLRKGGLADEWKRMIALLQEVTP